MSTLPKRLYDAMPNPSMYQGGELLGISWDLLSRHISLPGLGAHVPTHDVSGSVFLGILRTNVRMSQPRGRLANDLMEAREAVEPPRGRDGPCLP